MNRINDWLRIDEYEILHFEIRSEVFIEDLIHSNFKDFFIDCCFYYSSGNDATPIVGCLDITNKFIYCDIHEELNYNDSIYKLKNRLRENNCIEISYCTMGPNWFGLNKLSYKGNYGLEYNYEIKDFKAEFSLWKCDVKYFILIYIGFDNNVIWHNIFLKHKIKPKMICNYNYLSGVDFIYQPLNEEMKPDYWLGYGQHVDGFIKYKQLEYLSNYANPGEKIDLYKRMDNGKY